MKRQPCKRCKGVGYLWGCAEDICPRCKGKGKEKTAKEKARDKLNKAKRQAKRKAKAVPRKALKQWAEEVRERDKNCCAVCRRGVHYKKNPDGSIAMTNPKQIPGRPPRPSVPIVVPLNVHHLLPKERYPEYRTELRNGVTLCPTHHKYGARSFHKNSIWAALWLQKNRPDQYMWVVSCIGDPNDWRGK